jgi:hypothetical protein
MDAQPAVNLTPSLEEFVGWYNVQATGDGRPVLRSMDPLPEFEHAEFLDLFFQADEWFRQLITTPPNGPFDPLAEPPLFVRSDADDRSLAVDANIGLLEISSLRRIQEDFLGRYPLWRVLLIGEHPSCSIVVYPDAIRLGNRPVDANAEEVLQELAAENLALRAVRERPRREFVSHLQRLLCDAVNAIGEKPFVVCGVLDNYEGDYSRLTICQLVCGSDSDLYCIEGPSYAEKDMIWAGSAFGVNAAGEMISYIDIPETASYCLVLWLPRADYSGPLTIVERATGAQFPFELRAEHVIRTTPPR